MDAPILQVPVAFSFWPPAVTQSPCRSPVAMDISEQRFDHISGYFKCQARWAKGRLLWFSCCIKAVDTRVKGFTVYSPLALFTARESLPLWVGYLVLS
jgi:hypothetical protein